MYDHFLFFAEVALLRWLARKDVVIGIRIKRRIEIDEIDTGVGKFFPIRKPFQIVAEIQTIHSGQTSRDLTCSSPEALQLPCCATVHVARPARSILDFARNDKRDLVACTTLRCVTADLIFWRRARR